MKIIGPVLKDDPSNIHLNSQKLLIRSGHFLVGEDFQIIALPLGTRLIDRLISYLSRILDIEQQIKISDGDLLQRPFFHEFTKFAFNSHKSIPNGFYLTYEREATHFNTKRGLLSAKNNLRVEFYQIDENSDLAYHNFGMLTELMHTDLNTKLELVESSIDTYSDHHRSIVLRSDEGTHFYFSCTMCGRMAEQNAMNILKESWKEDLCELEEIETPDCKTIGEVADFLGIPKSRTAKAVFYKSGEKIIFTVIRGDLDVNENRLKRELGVNNLEIATDNDILGIGAIPGYASPINVDRGRCIVIIDDSIEQSPNLVAGANKIGKHILNLNLARDFKADIIADIALASSNNKCVCGGRLEQFHGEPIFTIRSYSDKKMNFIGKNGKPKPLVITEIAVNLFKLIASISEHNHDNDGLIWPMCIAPFDITLISILKKQSNYLEMVREIVESNYNSVFVDARDIKPGQKFIEADMRGFPLRLVVSNRLEKENMIELKRRGQIEVEKIPLNELKEFLKKM